MSEDGEPTSSRSRQHSELEPTNPFAHHLQGQVAQRSSAILERTPLPLQHCFRNNTLPRDSFRLFHLPLGESHLIALEGPALELDLQGSPWISLLYVVKGGLQITQGQTAIDCSKGGVLLAHELDFNWKSEDFSIICSMTTPERMNRLLRSIARHNGHQEPDGSCFSEHLHLQSTNHPNQESLFRALETNFAIASELAHQPDLIQQLELDQLIQRITLTLAFPHYSGTEHQAIQANILAAQCDLIEDLLSYIDQNLGKTLTLNQLEKYSNYSKRSLQYIFRQKLGCTATQWIRAQRLDRARSLLQNAHEGDTVTTIAQACGYRSMSLFSIEFQQRFHVKPSALLRRAQRFDGNC
jgi:AraC-like DNA-binding protein